MNQDCKLINKNNFFMYILIMGGVFSNKKENYIWLVLCCGFQPLRLWSNFFILKNCYNCLL